MHTAEIVRAATIENLPVLHDFVEQACLQAGVSPEIAHDLKLALEEIWVNVATHGYAGREAGPVRVQVDTDEGSVTVSVTDWGRPFDPTAAPPPDLNAHWAEWPVGGLGVHIVRRLVDDLRYYREPGGGNRLVLVKRLAGA
jgi:anti-sigma regulatory factor (Ser/Thr protein kinase)